MSRMMTYTVMGLSVAAGAGAVLWLLAVSMFLLATGGTYSRSYDDGTLVCGIPMFTREGWLWPAFSLFGAPFVVLAASWRTVVYCSGRLKEFR